MALRGSFSRSLIAAARSSVRSPQAATLPRRSPPLAAPRMERRRLSFAAPPRSLGEIGCAQSLLPIHSVVVAPRLTSHLSVSARACCELSQGTLCRTCQDR